MTARMTEIGLPGYAHADSIGPDVFGGKPRIDNAPNGLPFRVASESSCPNDCLGTKFVARAHR